MSTWPLAMTCGSQRFAAGWSGRKFFLGPTNPGRLQLRCVSFFWGMDFLEGFLKSPRFSHEFHDVFLIHLGFFGLQFFVSFLLASILFFLGKCKKANEGQVPWQLRDGVFTLTFLRAAVANLDALVWPRLATCRMAPPWTRPAIAWTTQRPSDQIPTPLAARFWRWKKVDQGCFEIKRPKKPPGKFTAFGPTQKWRLSLAQMIFRFWIWVTFEVPC